MSRLVDATLTLLREESACQQLENGSDIDDEDDTEHDEILMDAVSDLLPAFAKSMGYHFAPIFAKLFEPLMKFAVGIIVKYEVMISIISNLYLFVGKCRKLHVLHKIELWWLLVLLKLHRTWVLQLQAILM